LKVLVVTNLFPTVARPTLGTFVKAQVDGLRELGVEIDVEFVDRATDGPRAYLRLGSSVEHVVERSEPDVVHVMYGGVMAAAVTGAVRARPVVLTLYGRDVFGLPRDAQLHRRIASRLGVRASIRAARRASAVIVQSSMMADLLPADLRASVLVIPDGVDLERFQPTSRPASQELLGWDTSAKHVVFPWSRARPEKRFWLAETAVSSLNEGGTSVVQLHELAGVPHEDVPTWLNAADAVLLTSTHEGSPNAIKEALACGVPVVSVDVGDVAWLIGHVSGCHLAEPTGSDLAKKLALALSSSERTNGRERMRELSTAAIAARIKSVYESVLSR
jgi:glycosyltransferase involved in cell wall biosynthesis